MKHTIVLDLGYSNLDNCNLSYKTEEFEFKTAVLNILTSRLSNDGYNVIFTNINDSFELQLNNNVLVSDKADLYISIDTGYSSNAQVRGHWVFYWHDSSKGKLLAQIWNKHATHVFEHPSKGIRASRPGEWTDFSHIRRPNKHNIPTILIKHGYLTNKADYELLRSLQFQNQCAEVLFFTIKEYFKDKSVEQDWRVAIGEKALNYLVNEGLITSKDKFSETLLEPLPAWVIWEMFRRLTDR
ncbi:N-acetylmuramoyl-L-alanine amidase [Clostridium sp. 'deep sea']|uniref:N-acetylmuramoyl-L-alanine amidase family protein n=1 Tax=Clostridium sp. 'deep sea' TaxID=2779445 RepID=UPI0018968FB7|nr:N-acetylmuramoyl-L-alanine amidase [Clostridium sp. 'deep sea']QOR34324.1 N-acetylmuramoyl-L-alanine amidase [Clostridium sp. 'deep sea']